MSYATGRWRAAGTAFTALGLAALSYGSACSVSSSADGGAAGAGAGGAGAGGGGASGNAGAGGDDRVADGGPDKTAPYVLGMDVGGAGTRAGVREDANIVISFSEPMDPVVTQLAYQSVDLPAAAAVLSWDATGSVLTVNPSAELVYATGADPAAVAAKKYAFTITTTARDRSGNALGAPFIGEFTTLRRINQRIVLGPTEGTTITGSGAMYDCPTSFLIGDDAQNRPVRGILSFDIRTLPDGIVAFERGTFSGQTQTFGGDAIGSLQALLLEHTAFSLPITAAARTAAALSVVGVLANSNALRTSALEVTGAVADDYANRAARGDRSQYRLAMQRPTDNDDAGDAMTLHCSTILPALELVYLVP